MTLTRFLNYIRYGATRPTDISENRWRGMVFWYAKRALENEPLEYDVQPFDEVQGNVYVLGLRRQNSSMLNFCRKGMK